MCLDDYKTLSVRILFWLLKKNMMKIVYVASHIGWSHVPYFCLFPLFMLRRQTNYVIVSFIVTLGSPASCRKVINYIF